MMIFEAQYPLIHSRCFVVKLHGDYLDTRIKNTEGELSAYSPALDSLLDRILDDHGLIVCGWSGDWDHALRAAIIRAPNRRYPMFWASRGSVSTKADELIHRRAGKAISIADADAFFTELQQKIASQVESQRPDPRSVQLLVGTTKRYLGRPEFRIQLNDLLATEYRRLAAQLTAPEFSIPSSWSDEDFQRRIARYEAATEPLARIFGIIGRWGDDAAQNLAGEIISGLAPTEPRSGLVALIELRSYPAMLLIYAYGLGALKAGRYEALFRWFAQPVPTDNRTAKPAVTNLFLNAWPGSQQNIWQRLKGLEQRKTPLSDHLHDITTPWLIDYTVVDDRAYLYEMFEVLGGMAFLTLKTSKDELQKAIASQEYNGNFVWAPVGRGAWHTETRNTILNNLAEPTMTSALLKAGFSKGDEDFFKFSQESLKRLMDRVGW